MLSAPLRPIKHLIAKGRTCIVDFFVAALLSVELGRFF
jgi:hypothetical protein